MVRIRDDRLRDLFAGLLELRSRSTGDAFLACNEILAKNVLFYDFGEHYLRDVWPQALSPWGLLRKLALYFSNTLAFLWTYRRIRKHWARSGQASDAGDADILIHTDVIMKKVAASGELSDAYYARLEQRLRERGIRYAWLPSFCDHQDHEAYRQGFEQIREKRIPLVGEWQLLSFADIPRLAFFALAYPFRILAFALSLRDPSPRTRKIRRALLQSLDYPAVRNYARRLYGRNLAKALRGRQPRVISWYEGRASDKNLYLGLRRNPRTRIIGASMFVWPEGFIAMEHDENEARAGFLPDRVVVNGEAYLQASAIVDYVVGPSLRSAPLLDLPPLGAPGDTLLVVLPYYAEAARELAALIPCLEALETPVVIKCHPFSYEDVLQGLTLPGWASVSRDSFYELVPRARVVIGCMTGCLVESVCLGIPAISFTASRGLPLQYLPEYGRGEIWLEARTADGIREGVRRLERLPGRTRHSYAALYRSKLFSPVSDAAIDAAFDLADCGATSAHGVPGHEVRR